jgi:iron complex outermembrane receptor protein
MGRRIGRLALLRCVLIVLCTSSLLLGANAQGLAVPLGPQSLGDALENYAKRSGCQVVYRAEVVAGVTTQGAAAGLSARDTLAQLLRGTGLSFAFVNERTVAIFKEAPRTASPESSDPPVVSPGPAPTEPGKDAQGMTAGDTKTRGTTTVTHSRFFRQLWER